MDVVIGIDASTTATKAVAFGADGQVHASARTAVDRWSPEPTWHEQDAEQWWSSTVSALTEVQEQLIAGGHTVQAIGITHQRESFVCLDHRFSPVRPAMLWLDARAGEQVARLGDESVHEASGKPPSTTPSFYKLAWLVDHEPESLAATRYVADVHAFLSHRLTGRFATSLASADPMGLVDMTSRDWSDELLARVELTRAQMPALVAPGEVVGGISRDVAAMTGLPEELPVVAGGGDGQCGGLGAGVSRGGMAYLSLGTSITLGAHAADGAAASWDYRLLGSPLNTGVTIEGFIGSGALSVAWFREAFHGAVPEGIDALESMLVRSAPGAGGLRYLPYLGGSATPFWDDKARGVFAGITESHGAADFYRAVLEGLAFEAKVLLERLEVPAGRVDEAVVLGGGAVSPAWTEIIAAVLDRPLAISATPEATALGAAIPAAAVARLVPGGVPAAAESMVRMERRVSPDPDLVATYAPAAKGYAGLYPALKEWFHAEARAGAVGS